MTHNISTRAAADEDVHADAESPATSRSTWVQVGICLVANLPCVSGGMTLGFSAVTHPYMTSPDHLLRLDQRQASLVASCVSLSIPVGSLTAGAVMGTRGRREALLLSCLPAVVGWLTMAACPSYEGVLIGRLLTGLGTGLCCNAATVFVAEASSTGLRGFLTNGTNLGFSSGVLTVYVLGLVFKESWRVIAGLCGTMPLVAAVCLLRWMPESPLWLAAEGRTEEAIESLARMRSTSRRSPSVVAELTRTTAGWDDSNVRLSWTGVLRAFSRPQVYKPLCVMLTFFLFQQISGTFVMIFYGVKVVTEAGVTTDPFVITVLIGVTNVTFTVIGAWASRTFGRRPCAVGSGAGMTGAFALLVSYLHFTTTSGSDDALTTAPTHSWIPVLAVVMLVTSSTLGFLNLPWAMLGEVFPIAVRGVACAVCTCAAYAINFLVILWFPPMLSHLGNQGVFLFYGAMSFLATFFVWVFLPETENKSLAQLEQYYSGEQNGIKSEEKQSLKQNRNRLP